MKIAHKDTSKQVFIIAEIGNNHEGDFELAKEMLRKAAVAGADAVKFQTIIPRELVSSDQVERIGVLEKFQFSYEQFALLAKEAENAGILFMSTPFDEESVAELDNYVPAFKIASCDVTFFPLLKKIAQTGKPIIMSTGAATKGEILKSCEYIKSCWAEMGVAADNLALLHCVSCYPTPGNEANLRAINSLADIGFVPGYSDHTLGIDAAVLSVGLGARIVEKHFTLDKNYSDFRDHQLSADPHDLAEMVKKIRAAEAMLGSAEIDVANCELGSRDLIRRSAAARGDISVGTEITSDNVRWVRPGTGVSTEQADKLWQRKAARNIKDGELLNLEDVS